MEHIEDLSYIFGQATENLKDQGMIYIGELHPYKQYKGSKARFETAGGIHTLTCFNHHLSEYTQLARLHHLELVDLNEYFDENDKLSGPRILTLMLRKDVFNIKENGPIKKNI